MADIKNTLNVFNEFKNAFEQNQLDKAKNLFEQLKLALTQFGYPTNDINAEEQTKRLFLCREILEYGILLSIKYKDISSFERYVAQIKTYYYDYGKQYNLPDSSRQWTILGLNLLRLLAKNKLDEFHTELELIPIQLHSNIFIKHPIYLEQCIMEGAYHKVLKARADVPSETYNLFMDILMETVRQQIAESVSKSFSSLSVSDAQKLLAFTDVQQLKSFASSLGWSIGSVNNVESYLFQKDDSSKSKDIPAPILLKRLLHYAKEMERIV